MSRCGLTLLEVLLAVVLLAAIVIACLPLLAPGPDAEGIGRADPVLTEIADRHQLAPANTSHTEQPSSIGAEITGTWRVVMSPGGYGVAWVPADDGGSP